MSKVHFQPVAILTLLGCVLARLCEASPTQPTIEFDTDLLKERGFPTDIAQYFRDKPQFLPGTQHVSIFVNGLSAETIELNFDKEGRPCFDDTTWTRLRIRSAHMPHGCLAAEPSSNLQMSLKPSRASIDLLVPDTALLPDVDGFSRGGHATLLNYDIQASHSKFRSNRWNYLSARLEPGINIAGWALRHNGYYSSYQGRTRYRADSAYVAKAIEPWSAIFQAGRFSSNTLSWGGLPLVGVQIASDSAQAQSNSTHAAATGIVHTQAIAEIRQHGQLRYRTMLPPGPFELSSIPGIVPGIDMEVEIIEENGRRKTLRIPVPPAAAYAAQATTFQFAMGRHQNIYRNGNRKTHAPIVVTMESGTSLAPYMGGSAGLLWGRGYHSAFVSTNAHDTNKGRTAGLSLRGSKTKSWGSGIEISTSGSIAVSDRLVASTSLLVRSRGFSTPDQGLWLGGASNHSFLATSQRSITPSLSWSSPRWGTYTYSLSLSQPASWFGAPLHALTAGWRIKSTTLNMMAQHNGSRWQTVHLTVNVPLGTGSWQQSAQASGTYRSVTASYANKFPDQRGSYRLEATQNSDGKGRLGAFASFGTRFANLNSNLSAGPLSWYADAQASGGIVWTRWNLLFSPSGVADTFAIIRFPELEGLRLRSAGEYAITNRQGYVVVPRLSPYQKQTASVDGKSIPATYRLGTSTVALSPARGSVIHRTVSASRIRQLILTISMPNGEPLRQGTAVIDKSGNLISAVVGQGNVMLTNEQIGTALQLKTSEGQVCEVDYQPPVQVDPSQPYEELDASCS